MEGTTKSAPAKHKEYYYGGKVRIGNTEIKLHIENSGKEYSVINQPLALMHEHLYYEIHLIAKGKVYYRCEENEGKFKRLNCNDLILIPPNVKHTFLTEDRESARFVFKLKIDKLAQTDEEDTYHILKELLNVGAPCIILKNCATLKKLGEELHRCFINTGGLTRYKIKGYLFLWISEFLERLNREFGSFGKLSFMDVDGNTKEEDELFKLETVLLAFVNQKSKFTMDEVCKELFLSKKQLSLQIKKYYKLTYKQKILALRVEKAKQLLFDSDDSVETIALACGYSNITSFYENFRRYARMNPAQWRKIHAKNLLLDKKG